MNPKTRNLLIRTASGIVYVALMIAAVYTPFVAAPLAVFLAVAGIYESLRLAEHTVPGAKGAMPYLISLVGVIYICSGIDSSVIDSGLFFGFSLALIMAVFIPELIGDNPNPMAKIGTSLLSLIWIALPLYVLFLLWIPKNKMQVLAFFITIWAADTFAYLGGSLFGKHKLAERISPGKTWEGFLISCFMTVALCVGLSYIPYFSGAGMKLWKWVVFALLVDGFGLMGDLTESLFKRKAGVKDSGKIIPGHGGVLDRLDSILMAAIPLYFFCMS